MTGAKKRLALVLTVILIIAAVSGCGSGKRSNTNLPYLGEKSGSAVEAPKSTPAQPEPARQTGEKSTLALYFGDKEGYLGVEMRTIPKTPGIARAAMQELIRGPSAGTGLSPTLPSGTTLNSIKIEGGIATVDFSRELKSGHKGGTSGEMATVYSIVNTLTQFPSVQKVQILIDGQKVESLSGHLDLTRPLERNGKIIRQKQGTKWSS